MAARRFPRLQRTRGASDGRGNFVYNAGTLRRVRAAFLESAASPATGGRSTMIRNTLMAALAVALFALPGQAQQKANFAGTWKLNPAKSDFGPIPVPDSRTDVISQTDAAITEAVDSTGEQGEEKYTLTLTPDGQEKTIAADSPASHIGMLTLQKISSAWQAGGLAVTENAQYDQNDVLIKSNYTLSADGNTLTIASHATSSMGDVDFAYVFEKQGAAMASTASAPAAPAAGPAGAAATAGPHPNLSGTWKLNNAKSDFGQMPPPDSRIETIEDNEPAVKIDTALTGGQMGEMKFTTNVTTDGKESTSTIMGNEAKSTAHWEGNSLVVTTAMQFQDNSIQIKNTYALSPDGKTLNLTTEFGGPNGAMQQKMVFDKQP